MLTNRYNHPEMAAIWSDEHRYHLWMTIEIEFLNELCKLNLKIPNEFEDGWIVRICELEKETKHDLAAFVQWLEEYLKPIIPEDARFVHHGLTSSDIVDTAFSMQIRSANKILVRQMEALGETIYSASAKFRNTNYVGRTHGQAAEVMTLGQKFDNWSEALHHFRLQLKKMKYPGKLAGSVGNYKHTPFKVCYTTLERLGFELDYAVVDGQIVHRALFAEYMNIWALIASVVAKIATDIRLLSQTGIEELAEPFDTNQIGSSSMPHKRNPVLSENLCGLARIIRGCQTTAMQNIELWNERDISNSSVERIIFPEASILLAFMLDRLIYIFEGLSINTDLMEQHAKDVPNAQAAMLQLVKDGESRKEAHNIISHRS